jgi:hypothetical protein
LSNNCALFWAMLGKQNWRHAHNGAFVQSAPTKKPTPVGFFVAAGRQRGGVWSTSALVRGLDWSLPVGRGDPASAVYGACWTLKRRG